MTFIYEALRNHPQALYSLGGSSPFVDHSGYARTASATGTPGIHLSLCRGIQNARVLDSTAVASFGANTFNRGYESQPFTLSAWVRVISPGAVPVEQQILGNQNQMDGLTIRGTVVSFVTKYANAPEARASFDLQQSKAVYVLGIHTADKNSLYVNGDLVSEVSITEEQQNSLFVNTSTNLFSGTTAGTQKIVVNGVGVYPTALDDNSISRHFTSGRMTPSAPDAVSASSGSPLSVSLSNSDIFLDDWWTTEEDWNAATHQNTAVINDMLVPQFDGSVSVAGEWVDVISLSSSGATSIYGVSLNWQGEGAVVSVSIDGSSWQEAKRGVKINSIPQGFDPTDKELYIRVSFAGGIENDQSYLDNLNVIGVSSPTAPPQSGRTITLNNATQERDYHPLELHENWGVEIHPGGNLIISADSSEEQVPARTIELWIKRDGTAPTTSITGTSYINGSVAVSALPQDQWVLLHIVSSTNITGSITITGPAQIGHIGVFDTALTAAQIAAQYNFYVGTNPLVAGDNSVIRLADSPSPIKIYAHDWSIQASG